MTEPLYEWTYRDKELTITVLARTDDEAYNEVKHLSETSPNTYVLERFLPALIGVRQVEPRAKAGKVHTFE